MNAPMASGNIVHLVLPAARSWSTVIASKSCTGGPPGDGEVATPTTLSRVPDTCRGRPWHLPRDASPSLVVGRGGACSRRLDRHPDLTGGVGVGELQVSQDRRAGAQPPRVGREPVRRRDRKSTRLNS